jgi:hypothetical protein
MPRILIELKEQMRTLFRTKFGGSTIYIMASVNLCRYSIITQERQNKPLVGVLNL